MERVDDNWVFGLSIFEGKQKVRGRAICHTDATDISIVLDTVGAFTGVGTPVRDNEVDRSAILLSNSLVAKFAGLHLLWALATHIVRGHIRVLKIKFEVIRKARLLLHC